MAAQRRVLARLVRRARDTRFGRAHGFANIDGVRAFRTAVPLRDWAAFYEEWWGAGFPVLDDVSWPGRIPFFAETSGTTTARTKHIPVSHAAMRSNRRVALDLALHHVAHRPGSAFFGGPNLILGGSTALRRLPGGARSGDLSGIAAATLPFAARFRTLPSRATALGGDWDRKLDRVVAEATGTDLRSVSGTTSWLLLLFERLLRAAGRDRLEDAFPRLELVVHGGVGFAPYRERFAQLLGPRIARAEAYAASEGFFALSDGVDRGDGSLRLALDNGVFFEFVPSDELGAARPTRHTVADAEPGADYALVVSSDAGLFGYVVGDLVRFVGRDPPRVLVTGRTGQTLSAFGEHLSAGELDRAIAVAARAAGVAVGDYTATIVPPDAADARGGHLFVVETDGAPDPAAFAVALDRALADGNDDYRAHRAGDRGMRPPLVRVVPGGSFERWLRARGRVGGQVKVPRVIADAAQLGTLLPS